MYVQYKIIQLNTLFGSRSYEGAYWSPSSGAHGGSQQDSRTWIRWLLLGAAQAGLGESNQTYCPLHSLSPEVVIPMVELPIRLLQQFKQPQWKGWTAPKGRFGLLLIPFQSRPSHHWSSPGLLARCGCLDGSHQSDQRHLQGQSKQSMWLQPISIIQLTSWDLHLKSCFLCSCLHGWWEGWQGIFCVGHHPWNTFPLRITWWVHYFLLGIKLKLILLPRHLNRGFIVQAV